MIPDSASRHPFRWFRKFGFGPWACIVALMLGVTACDKFEEPELDLDNLYSYTEAPLAVLLSASEISGRIDYTVVERSYADYLDRFVELAADAGPTTYPAVYFQARHRAAYYINVHNGLVMQTWLRRGAGTGDAELRFDPAWLDEAVHRVDGQTVSINDVAERALAQGFAETPLALITGTVTGPHVPNPPLEAEVFQRALDTHARTFLSDERSFERVLQPDGQTFLYFAPPVLEQHAETLGNLEALIDRFVPEDHPDKLGLLRAAHEGTLRFRPTSDRIHLPGVPLPEIPETSTP